MWRVEEEGKCHGSAAAAAAAFYRLQNLMPTTVGNSNWQLQLQFKLQLQLQPFARQSECVAHATRVATESKGLSQHRLLPGLA